MKNPQGAGSVDWLRDVLRNLPQPVRHPPELPLSLEGAWQVAAEACGMDAWALAREVGRQYGLPCEPLPATLPEEAIAWMASPVQREYGAVLVRHEDGYLVVAVCDPTPADLRERLRFASDMPVELVVAPPADLRRLREGALGTLAIEPVADDDHEEPRGGTAGEFDVEDASAPSDVVRLCNMMLRQAIRMNASDIHVQPVGGTGLVRMRIDGLLHKSGRLPLQVMTRLIGRVKAVAGMDPTDHLHPQDGHARAVSRTQRLDLRIATIPVTGGEKLVIRLLGGHSVLRLDDLDLPELERRQIANLVGASMGVVLAAGPTGSGKTTTLYSMLAEQNRADVNIVTVEEPVEIRVPLLAQTEVNPRAGLNFATALRSVVRQDPDVILIGEIRDTETASIAMQAAITGHLVFASIHANDAVSVLPRLAELGVDGTMAAEAVRGVVSQRLVRTLCRQCARPASAPWTAAEAWLRDHVGLEEPLRAVGCAACAGSGYRGRRGILQVLTVTPEVGALLDHSAPLSDVRALARQQGMRFLAESALDRVRRGQTSVEEVLRVMGTDFWRELQVAVDAAPPLAVIQASAAVEDAGDRGAVLLVAKDDAWRARLAEWLAQLDWRVVEATDEAQVRAAIDNRGDFALAVIDTEQLLEQRVRLLLAVRGVFAGAGVPLLFLAGGAEALEEHARSQPHTRVVPRPRNVQELRQQLARALLA